MSDFAGFEPFSRTDRSVWLQRLLVCLEESIYIHNIKDMKLLKTILDVPANPTGELPGRARCPFPKPVSTSENPKPCFCFIRVRVVCHEARANGVHPARGCVAPWPLDRNSLHLGAVFGKCHLRQTRGSVRASDTERCLPLIIFCGCSAQSGRNR